MVKQLEGLNMAYEFTEAVDGRNLPGEGIGVPGLAAFPPWPSWNGRRLSGGEIGCLLSHLGIYEKMVDEDIPWACVFEDDAVLGEDLGRLLADGRLTGAGHELLLLGHSGRNRDFHRGAEHSPKKKPVFSRYHIATPVECPYRTHAYVIRRSAAVKLLRHAFPLRMPMDFLTGHSPAIGVALRVLAPPCVTIETALPSLAMDDRDRDSGLYFHRVRRMKRSLGNRYPVLRAAQKRVADAFAAIPVHLRKAGLLDEDSYAEKRYFNGYRWRNLTTSPRGR